MTLFTGDAVNDLLEGAMVGYGILALLTLFGLAVFQDMNRDTRIHWFRVMDYLLWGFPLMMFTIVAAIMLLEWTATWS